MSQNQKLTQEAEAELVKKAFALLNIHSSISAFEKNNPGPLADHAMRGAVSGFIMSICESLGIDPCYVHVARIKDVK